MNWLSPDESNTPELWERQRGDLEVDRFRFALVSVAGEVPVMIGVYDGQTTMVIDPVDVTMERSDQGEVRIVITGASIHADASS